MTDTIDHGYLRTFQAILATRDQMPFSQNDVDDELEAAQIPSAALGPLWGHECRAGRLAYIGTVASNRPSRRKARIGLYRRIIESAAA